MHGLLEVDPPSALKRLESGAMLVDVRERPEIAQAAYDHPNVIVMPLSEFQQRHTELPRDRPLIMACRSGQRSFQAMQYLIHHGHGHVSNLHGGMIMWRTHGLPVRSDAA